MKKLFIALMSVAFFNSCEKEATQPAAKNITEWRVKKEKLIDPANETIFIYDAQGMIQRYVNSENIPIMRYEKVGNNILHFNANNQTSHFIAILDNQNRQIESFRDSTDRKNVYKYNENGQLIEHKLINNTGVLIVENQYIIDGKNINKVVLKNYDNTQKITSTYSTEWEYFTDKLSSIQPINFGRFWEAAYSPFLVKKAVSKDSRNALITTTEYQYTFDDKNRVKTRTETITGESGSANSLTRIFEYEYYD